MSQPHILIVEDEVKLASLLSDYLKQADYQPHCIHRGDEVIDWLKIHSPDLILLDVMLPGKDGLTLCQEIRSFSQVPIFMVTARVDEIDRLLGLELGADDYICKPFSPREVIARIKALFRRIHHSQLPHGQALHMDPHRHEISLDGQILELTHIEFQLIAYLAKDIGRIFSREELMKNIYKDNRIVSDRTIDSHIKKLRKRLSEIFPHYEFIHSVYGAGYRFDLVKLDE